MTWPVLFVGFMMLIQHRFEWASVEVKAATVERLQDGTRRVVDAYDSRSVSPFSVGVSIPEPILTIVYLKAGRQQPTPPGSESKFRKLIDKVYGEKAKPRQ
jgi:hypothetical protein